MNTPSVPFLDLRPLHDRLRGELIAAINQVIDASAFAGGPFVERFEEDFATFCGTRHAVGVASGTDALWLALLATGVRPGDEVITVPSTFIATAEAITYAGATPVFVDVDERTYTMDPRRLERAITPRTRAIIPVHLYGQMADMDPIMEIARRHRLSVIEDACQAHGAEYKGRRAGSIGDAGCFSFYPGKNLGALGEAGAVVTNDDALADEVAVLRNHGQVARYQHDAIGWNGRMDGFQAAVLRIKLRHLAAANAARRAHAAMYDRLLRDVDDVVPPAVAPHNLPNYHLYVVRVQDRDRVLRELGRRGVQCGIHYPTPVHLHKAYEGLRLGPGSFPVSERLAREALSLPMFPELASEQVAFVARELETVVQEPAELASAST